MTYDEVPADPAPGHPGRRGQELLLPFGRGLPACCRGWSRRRRRAPLSEWWKGGHGFRLLLPQGGRRSRSSSSAATSCRT
ncbi:MAG: hypothetical protein MZW92_53475 [Comamonadaceae bacterium]|nr:hypothetical protein [Comamonadaceae bacterium]